MTTDTLTICVEPRDDIWDPVYNRFLDIPETTLELKHSLVSIRHWEAKWKKPWMHTSEKFTPEQFIDYVKCMTITKNVKPDVYYGMSTEQVLAIRKYIEDPTTATWFKEETKKKRDNKIVTCECIYSWMRSLGIPFECEKWHFNQLMTLIKVCIDDDKPEEKQEINEDFYRKRAAENERRRAEYEAKMKGMVKK